MEKSEKDSVVIREAGRIIAGGHAGHQNVRKGEMNRIRNLVRHKNEDIPFDQPEEKKEARTFDKKYRDANLPKLIKEMFAADKLTGEERDYLWKALELAKKASSLEQSYKGPMKKFVSTEPVWTKFLVHIPGIGEVLAANLIGKLANCQKYDKVSSLWRHFGFHLVCPNCTEKLTDKVLPVLANVDGKCPKCNSIGVSPKKKKGQRIDYDKNLRTLAWNIAASLIKQKSPVYYDIYVKEKERQCKRVFAKGELKKIYGKPYEEKDTSLKLGHANSRASRKMVKIFLQHFWEASRELAGLPIRKAYVEAELGHKDIITWKDVLKKNGVEPPKELAA